MEIDLTSLGLGVLLILVIIGVAAAAYIIGQRRKS